MAANQKVQTVTSNVDLAQIQNRRLSAARRHSGGTIDGREESGTSRQAPDDQAARRSAAEGVRRPVEGLLAADSAANEEGTGTEEEVEGIE